MPKPWTDTLGNIIGTDVFDYVSGTIGLTGSAGRVAVFGGDIYVSGSVRTPLGTLGTGTGTGAGEVSASYVVLSSTSSLANERVLTVSGSSGLLLVDTGTQASLTINNNVVATVSGTTFTGATNHSAGLSGSLTRLTDGRSYMVAGSNVTIVSSSNGQVIVSSTGGGAAVIDATARLNIPLMAGVRSTSYTTSSKQIIGSVLFDPAYVNAGDVIFNAVLDTSDVSYAAVVDLYDLDGIVAWPPGQIAGSVLSATSLTPTLKTVDLSSIFGFVTGSGTIEVRLWMSPSGSNVQVTSKGAWLNVPAAALSSTIITGSSNGSGGEPYATYLLLSSTGSLVNERVFDVSGSSGLIATDAGAGNSFSLSINNNIVATVSGARFTGATTHASGVSGSLTRLADGRSYLVAGSNVTITSESNGQIVISSTTGGASVGGWIDNGIALRTTASIAVDSAGASASDKGTNVYVWISGSISGSGTNDKRAVFGGDVTISGTLRVKTPSTTDQYDRIVWELDDTTWSIASSGVTGSVAPLSGAAVSSVTGIVNGGRALDFAGASSYLVGAGAHFFTGSQLSVSVWFKPAALSTGAYQLLAMKSYSGAWANPYIAWSMYLYPTNSTFSMECQLTTGGAISVMNTLANTIKRGTWNHAVFTYDGAMMRCYINGTEEGSAAKTGDVDYGSSNADYNVGKNVVANLYQFTGSIDQIKVMNVCRTPDEVRRAYSKEIMKYYFFNE